MTTLHSPRTQSVSRARRLSCSLAAGAALALAAAAPVHAQGTAPGNLLTDPVGDAPAGADIAQLTARADASTGTLSAAVRLAGSSPLSAGRITVRFGVRDAAGICVTAGKPSVTFPSSSRPTRNSVAQWDVPGSERRDPVTGQVLQQVPLVGTVAASSLTDPALRTAADCAQAETANAATVLDATAPVAVSSMPLNGQVAGTVVQVNGRLLQAASFSRAHLRLGVTCVSAASSGCTGMLRVRLQNSKRTAGTEKFRLASGQTRTLSVLISKSQRKRLASRSRTVVATASASGQSAATVAELTATPKK